MMAATAEVAMPCGRCGYDLRGTLADGVCGECGLPVAASAAGPTAAWYGRVARGAWVLVACLAASYPAGVASVAFTYASGAAVLTAPAGLAVAYAAGGWLFTSPVWNRQYGRCRASDGPTRVAARVLVAASGTGLAALLVAFAAGFDPAPAAVPRSYVRRAVRFVGGWTAPFAEVRRLARAVGSPAVAFHAGVVVVAGCVLAGGSVAAAVALPDLPPMAAGSDVAVFACGAGSVLSGLYAFPVLFELAVALGRARREADAVAWLAAAGGTKGNA